MSTVNVACSNQTHFVYVWDKRYIYLYTLVYVTKLFLSLMAENLYLPLHITGYHSAHIRLKGYSSQKSVDFLLNPFCIERVTIHFSACNFAIVYLYKEIKFKPTIRNSYQFPNVPSHEWQNWKVDNGSSILNWLMVKLNNSIWLKYCMMILLVTWRRVIIMITTEADNDKRLTWVLNRWE